MKKPRFNNCIECRSPLTKETHGKHDDPYEPHICDNCFNEAYGYCDTCGNLFRYHDAMNDGAGNPGVACIICIKKYHDTNKVR